MAEKSIIITRILFIFSSSMSDEDYDNEKFSDTEEINPRAHRQLMDGVSRLHTAQHIRNPARIEAASKRSNFYVAKTLVDDTSANEIKTEGAVGKKLKDIEAKSRILNKPLEKPSADRLKRSIGYEKAKEKLMRWDAIVTKNKSSDHIVSI